MTKLAKLVLVQFLPWFLGMLLLATMGFIIFDIIVYIDAFFEKDIPFGEILSFELPPCSQWHSAKAYHYLYSLQRL
jgi:lipopolysaccharide export LptBFGC system permease protein LptF